MEQQGKVFSLHEAGPLGIHVGKNYIGSFTPYIHKTIPEGLLALSAKDNDRELLEDVLGDYLHDPGEGEGFLNDTKVLSTNMIDKLIQPF